MTAPVEKSIAELKLEWANAQRDENEVATLFYAAEREYKALQYATLLASRAWRAAVAKAESYQPKEAAK